MTVCVIVFVVVIVKVGEGVVEEVTVGLAVTEGVVVTEPVREEVMVAVPEFELVSEGEGVPVRLIVFVGVVVCVAVSVVVVETVGNAVLKPDPVLVVVTLLVTVGDPVWDSVWVTDAVTVGDGLGDQTLGVTVFVADRDPVVVLDALRLPVPELDVEGVGAGDTVRLAVPVAVKLELRLVDADPEGVFVGVTEGNMETVGVPVNVWVFVLDAVFVGVMVIVRVGVSGVDPKRDRVMDAENV